MLKFQAGDLLRTTEYLLARNDGRVFCEKEVKDMGGVPTSWLRDAIELEKGSLCTFVSFDEELLVDDKPTHAIVLRDIFGKHLMISLDKLELIGKFEDTVE